MVLCLALVCFACFWSADKDTVLVQSGQPVEESSQTLEASEPPPGGPQPVYLVGAVNHPGIYHVEPGTCLFEVVEKAGGLSADAAHDAINLAQLVEGHQLLRIPSQADVAAGHLQAAWTQDEASSHLIDLNRATAKDLESLPGIGPVTAQAIVAYRQQNGPFQALEALMQVPGIKQARFDALKDLICLGAPIG